MEYSHDQCLIQQPVTKPKAGNIRELSNYQLLRLKLI